MGPHGAVVPSFRTILQSYVRCSGSASTTSFPMIHRNCRNSLGTLSSGFSEATATCRRSRTVGSMATVSSQVSENSAVSCQVHFSKQPLLLNRISSIVHVPWDGCLIIHSNGRNTSISGSMGVTSNFSSE